jgi:hypothetical protein
MFWNNYCGSDSTGDLMLAGIDRGTKASDHTGKGLRKL